MSGIEKTVLEENMLLKSHSRGQFTDGMRFLEKFNFVKAQQPTLSVCWEELKLIKC